MINDKYDWPMEGFLLPYAPPTKSPGATTTTDAEKGAVVDHGFYSSTPLRLLALKNGVGDATKAVTVVAPVCNLLFYACFVRILHACAINLFF